MKVYFHAVMFARIISTCVIDIFFWICNFLKDLFLYLLCEICFGKKNSYNFGDEGNSICHAVTNSVQKVFFGGMPQYLHQCILWVNRPSYVRRKTAKKKKKNWKDILKLFNCAINLVTMWRHSVTTHLACQQTYPVQARGGGGGKTFC